MRKLNQLFLLVFVASLFSGNVIAQINSGVKIKSPVKVNTLSIYAKDIDGNTYKTVKIGNQVWMAENLKTSKYQDGSIASVHYYNDNANGEKDTYGGLYGASQVKFNKLCPTGWRIPNVDDWNILLGAVGNDIGKLKEKGTTHWKSPNSGATNSVGFSALPAGYKRKIGQQYRLLGERAYFWCDPKGANNVPVYQFDYNKNTHHRFVVLWTSDYADYYSVRCIKE